jgi:hypothetical protein
MVLHNPLVSFEVQEKRTLSTKSSVSWTVTLWASLGDKVLAYESVISLRYRERAMVSASRQ